MRASELLSVLETVRSVIFPLNLMARIAGLGAVIQSLFVGLTIHAMVAPDSLPSGRQVAAAIRTLGPEDVGD